MDLLPDIHKGDKISILSPAGIINNNHVMPAVNWLRKEGYEIILGEHVFEENNQFAGTDQQRTEDLQKALDDPEIKLIICSRGGYGTGRIIEKLDFSLFFKNPKWIVGFSDITVLHNYLNILGIPSVHGVMPRFFLDKNGLPSQSLKSLFYILDRGKPEYFISNHTLNRNGTATGELTGGNLSIIQSLRGTPYDPDFSGKILFLEDVGDYLYRIDRMMLNLKLGGKLEKLAGMVIGYFSDMKDGSVPFGKNAWEIIMDAVGEYNFPVCFGFPAGHKKLNLALKFGVKWKLDVAKDGSTLKLI